MRFKDIKRFKVDELVLDEGNYRFKKAPNQNACIEKIHQSNPQYFKNLLTSVAEDDLGELLLVYKDEEENIVLDGNRRLAALKVLSEPKKYSPSEAVRQHAEDLRAKYKVDFANIQAQVSDNKQLIYKTVYERHAAGQGKSRINWSAYGAARFRYDFQLEDGNDWYSVALLLETERKNPKWTDFIDSAAYSHEVFRRIFKSALDKGVISRSIFSDRNQRIKTTADKKLLEDATKKVSAFLEAMQSKDISLSRSGKYADKESVDEFVTQFGLSPDNARSKPPASSTSAGGSSSGTKAGVGGAVSGMSDTTGGAAGDASEGSGGVRDKQGLGITESSAIAAKLKALGSKKHVNLYNSLCIVSLKAHPQLLYTGAWNFFESLSTLMGKKDGTSFDSYLGSKMEAMGFDRPLRKDFSKTLKDISDIGNLNKHSGTYHSSSAQQLRNDFVTLEPLIIAMIDALIAEKKAAA